MAYGRNACAAGAPGHRDEELCCDYCGVCPKCPKGRPVVASYVRWPVTKLRLFRHACTSHREAVRDEAKLLGYTLIGPKAPPKARPAKKPARSRA